MQVLQAWGKGGGQARPTVYRYPGLNVLQNIFSINVRASNGIDHFDWMLQSCNQEEYKSVKQKATDFNILKVVSQTQLTLARIISSWVSGWPTFDPSD